MLACASVVVVAGLPAGAYAKDGGPSIKLPGKSGWKRIESVFFTIDYKDDIDMRLVEKRLKRRYFFSAYTRKRDSLDSVPMRVADRMDLLFRRAGDILDMHPPDMHINVKIFKDRDDLADEYHRIFRRRERLRSFYIYKLDTIFTSETDISDSVMAHEMGHAIVDHYFVIMPPEKVKEMLASYVDLHLDD